MRTIGAMVILLLLAISLGCAGMTPREQRVLSGGAIGAGGGAVVGAVTGHPGAGAAIGGAAGAVGGLLYDQYQRDRYRDEYGYRGYGDRGPYGYYGY